MRKRFEVLDVFRGAAAVLVAIFHFSEAGGTLRSVPLIAGSNRFVAFFFVLSGFIIYHNYRAIDNSKQRFDFVVKRFFRLYPLHLFMLVLFFVFELCKASLFELGIFKNPAFSTNTIPALIKNLFMLQGVVKTYKDFSWNYPSWSISAELFAYAAFAFVIIPLNRIPNYFRSILLFLLSTISLFLLLISVPYFDLVIECIYGFFIGCLVERIYSSLKLLKLKKIFFTILEIIGFISVIVSVCYLPNKFLLIISPLYGLVILIFSFERGLLSKLFINKITVWVGTLSYSIYMTHALVAAVMRVILSLLKVTPTVYNISTIIFLGIVIIFSSFTYRLIEKKGQKVAQNFVA